MTLKCGEQKNDITKWKVFPEWSLETNWCKKTVAVTWPYVHTSAPTCKLALKFHIQVPPAWVNYKDIKESFAFSPG